jgi:hypothetical protein
MGLALVALAGWLFYGHTVGISATLLLVTLAAAGVVVNPIFASPRDTLAACAVLVASIRPADHQLEHPVAHLHALIETKVVSPA